MILIAFTVMSFICGHKVGKKANNNLTPNDTIIITNTVTETLPDPDTVWFERIVKVPVDSIKIDTVYQSKEIPIIVHDTIYVPLSVSYYERLDGRLRLWVSGYQTSLVKWELDEQTKLVSCRKRWGISAGLGVAAIYSPFTQRFDAGIGTFFGLTYTF